ncbi:ATP synthase F1 subunit delta [Neoehrlichia mikurensis]|uniref:ATP synthase subunit delta n=1 Tax=Neoehrlichia mikurensis TaxID=89586 RepID=A0A9Q9F632_9RICK|nr:ATP synthase F1 subunit delta [Neoehrlichia mikurensis]QXK92261.1 ATP synthase F1 subunit delta [Neoehrlichia mikurensis]QXK92715.1 ATP synthase F1 subunit delta [Neoehrlichia mikurensis]QXK93954.1 ATP synthase F1 subunit delta [Neoehrlichia mikurensis]UTO55881.1 ATP synthase F1 subunit delta [Neoehrlichia mikurensis]UTO56797.1 ATP synthase F1 subunit delta [Neoehrlichia mikurensis]
MNQRNLGYIIFNYAQVLFDLSQDNFDKICSDVQVFTEAIKIDKVYSFLVNPVVSINDKNAIINSVNDVLEKVLLNFVCVVIENKRAPLLLEIFKQFFILVKQHQKKFDIEITSSYLLSKKEINEIIDVLKTKYGTAENIVNNVDPEILGGFIIRIGFNIIDVSLNSYLQNLSAASKIAICKINIF